MAVSIQELLSGDTNYIAKHNANYQNLKVAVEALQVAISSQTAGGGGNTTVNVAYEALFGTTDAILGEGSYLPSQSSAHNLSVAAGSAYVAASDAAVTKLTSTGMSFSGQTTGTYYIKVDNTGEPSFSADPSNALYSLQYDSGTGDFSNIQRYGNLAWVYKDWNNAQTNLWSITYDGLDDRLASIEGAAYGVLSKTAVATDITLTTQEALEQSLIEINDGPQTANIILEVPAEARVYQVVNNASASYHVTVKTSAGTGYDVTGNHFAILYCDGVDTVALFDLDRSTGGGTPPNEFKLLTDTPGSYTGQSGLIIKVKDDETGLEFVSAPLKQPVKAATTANITLSGTQSIDNISLIAGDRCLVWKQTAPAENGIYVVASGAWTRAKDADSWAELVGVMVAVEQGNTYADMLFMCTVDAGGTLDTTAVTFQSSDTNTFLGLTDTPANFSGAGGHAVKVNSGGTALEFVDDPYFVGGFLPGAGTASATMAVHVFAAAVAFPSGLTGSYGTAETAATAQTDYDIQKNGASVGTLRFAAAASTATFIMASPTTFSAGDKLQIVAPGTLDSTLADIAFNLQGTR